MLIKHLELPPIGTNCYILEDEVNKVCAVVDPGGDADAVLEVAAEDGMTIVAVLLTHGHYDHTGAVPELREALPALKVYAHPDDIAQMGGEIMPNIGPVTPYDEGDVVEIGDMKITVLHTPGHTAGGVCLKVDHVLCTGDTLFKGSMGRTDLPSGDYAQIMASLKRLYDMEGDYNVLSGHMGATTLSQERSGNYYMKEAAGR